MARIVIVSEEDDVIRAAAAVLGTATTSETVDRALREVVNRREWIELFRELDERAEDVAEGL